MIRRTLALTGIILLSACATAGKPPSAPDGPGKPINSPASIEALSRAPDAIDPDEQRRREHERAVLFLPEPETIRVPMAFASARFQPEPGDAYRIQTLAKNAARIQARGRTDGLGDPKADRETARLRAESARQYLINRGIDPAVISVSSYPGADLIDDNARYAGRHANRRVDLVFWPAIPSTDEARR